ncbi:MAG: ketopantoate reductase family protein, partial [Spirochaetales bacterium]
MEIRRIGVLGVGAVGASLVSMMMDAPASPGRPQVAVIADGERATRLTTDGIRVNGTVYRPPIVDTGPFDLILVVTKSLHLEAALPLLRRAAGDTALVMSLLNGGTSESILRDALGHKATGRVVPGMIVGIDALRDDSGVRYLNRGTIHFGSDQIRFPVAPEALSAITSALNACGIPATVSDDITRTLWWKFMVNVGINQASAVLLGTYGLFQESREAMDLMVSAMNEVITLSQLEGTGLTSADVQAWVTTLMGL